MTNKNSKAAFTAKEISIIAIFTAITVALSQISLLLPFSPVPISFGLVAVYITGIMLKPRHAIFVQVCYLLLGAVGVPVFSNFKGGIGALFGSTGGYLLVYPVMAWIVSMTLNSSASLRSERNQHKALIFVKAVISICAAHTILYLGGTAWLSVITGNTFLASLSLAVFPFIPLDIAKIVFCILVIVPLRSRLLSMNLLIPDYKTTVSIRQ